MLKGLIRKGCPSQTHRVLGGTLATLPPWPHLLREEPASLGQLVESQAALETVCSTVIRISKVKTELAV